MRCDDLRRRLDAAGPAGLLPGDHVHAGGCAACAAEIRAALAVERMLAVAPPAASSAFTAKVMERVLATDRARLRLAERPRASAWNRLMQTFADEPLTAVTLALAPVLLVLGIVWPGTGATLVAFVRDGFAAWIATVASGASAAGSPGIDSVASSARTAAESVIVVGAIVVAMFGFQWVGEIFGGGGSVTSASRAHKASTSRRNPS